MKLNKKGIALLMVTVSVAIITMLITELNYNTRVNSTIVSNYKDEVSAYYLAKSSVNLALLRIMLYNKVKNLKLGDFSFPKQVLTMIWSFPFIFPPDASMFTSQETELGQDVGLGLSSFLESINENSNISKVGKFDHNIVGLDNKFNINIISMDEALSFNFKEQIISYYSNKIFTDKSFGYRYPIEYIERVYNNIVDWIDYDSLSKNGGYEDSYYRNTYYKPRNAPIPTLEELHLIDGMTDEIYDFFSSILSVFSSNSININNIDQVMWKIIDPNITDDVIEAINLKFSEEGAFETTKDLETWIGENTRITSTQFNPLKIPIKTDDLNFKIEATGYSGKILKRIVVYVSEIYEEILLQEKVIQQEKNNQLIPKTIYWELD